VFLFIFGFSPLAYFFYFLFLAHTSQSSSQNQYLRSTYDLSTVVYFKSVQKMNGFAKVVGGERSTLVK